MHGAGTEHDKVPSLQGPAWMCVQHAKFGAMLMYKLQCRLGVSRPLPAACPHSPSNSLPNTAEYTVSYSN